MPCKSIWRTRTRGTPRQIGKKFKLSSRASSSKLPKGLQKSMFYERTGYYAGKVKMDTPSNARISADWLEGEFDKAWKRRNRSRMVRILRIAQLAANRARAILKKKSLSEKERKEFKTIANIYEKSSDRMRGALEEYTYHEKRK